MFADKLKELRERATDGPWWIGEMIDPDGHALAWLGNVYIDSDAPKLVNGSRYKRPRDDAEFIVFLANHADQIEALVKKTDKLIAYIGAKGEISRNKINEIQIIDDVLDALAALDKEQS
jgi:hypothetical protein